IPLASSSGSLNRPVIGVVVGMTGGALVPAAGGTPVVATRVGGATLVGPTGGAPGPFAGGFGGSSVRSSLASPSRRTTTTVTASTASQTARRPRALRSLVSAIVLCLQRAMRDSAPGMINGKSSTTSGRPRNTRKNSGQRGNFASLSLRTTVPPAACRERSDG